MASELFNKVYSIVGEIVDNGEIPIHEFGVYEDTNFISLHCLFELDEDECVKALKKVSSKIFINCEEIEKIEINQMFCEALFYF